MACQCTDNIVNSSLTTKYIYINATTRKNILYLSTFHKNPEQTVNDNTKSP